MRKLFLKLIVLIFVVPNLMATMAMADCAAAVQTDMQGAALQVVPAMDHHMNKAGGCAGHYGGNDQAQLCSGDVIAEVPLVSSPPILSKSLPPDNYAVAIMAPVTRPVHAKAFNKPAPPLVASTLLDQSILLLI
jgi:hypothetical protein